MSRNKGTFTFAANFEPLVQAPLDARMRVSSIADLISPAIWLDSNSNLWLYSGLLVSIVDDPDPLNNGLYFLSDKDTYTTPSSWIKIGATSGVIDASGTSSVSFQLNNGGYGVILTDTAGNLTVNTFDGSLATITVGGVYINGFSGAMGFESTIQGNGVVNWFNIEHNLGTNKQMVSMWDVSTNYAVYPQIKRDVCINVITFTDPPDFGQDYNVIIIGF